MKASLSGRYEHGLHPDFPVDKSMVHEFDIVMVGEFVVVVLQSGLDLLCLFSGQKACCSWTVGESPECNQGHDNSKEALKDENPCPSRSSPKTIHLVDSTGQKTSESSSNGGGRE